MKPNAALVEVDRVLSSRHRQIDVQQGCNRFSGELTYFGSLNDVLVDLFSSVLLLLGFSFNIHLLLLFFLVLARLLYMEPNFAHEVLIA